MVFFPAIVLVTLSIVYVEHLQYWKQVSALLTTSQRVAQCISPARFLTLSPHHHGRSRGWRFLTDNSFFQQVLYGYRY